MHFGDGAQDETRHDKRAHLSYSYSRMMSECVHVDSVHIDVSAIGFGSGLASIPSAWHVSSNDGSDSGSGSSSSRTCTIVL